MSRLKGGVSGQKLKGGNKKRIGASRNEHGADLGKSTVGVGENGAVGK